MMKWGLFKTFQAKLFVDLKVPPFTPDGTWARELSGRRMQFGMFAGCAAIDGLLADSGIAGQLSLFPHRHAPFRAPGCAWGRFAAVRFGIVAIFTGSARIIHEEDSFLLSLCQR